MPISEKKVSNCPLLFLLLFLLNGIAVRTNAQTTNPSIDTYFQSIRNNDATLIAFFAAMPKGGDLHNHLTGSIYAEWYLDYSIQKKYWIDTSEWRVVDALPKTAKDQKGFLRLDTIYDKKYFPALQQRLFQEWSIKDYYDGFRPSDKHFFDAFGKFPPMPTWADCKAALLELKDRAKKENVQYLEIMLRSIPIPKTGSEYNDRLRQAAQLSTPDSLNNLLEVLYSMYDAFISASAKNIVDSIREMHKGIDDDNFTMRYLSFVKREASPIEVFQSLMGAFKCASIDPLVVGVNIVSREDGQLSMKDYRLQMQFFRFLRQKMPQVNCSLHAGELTIGTVRPEDLTFHISEAVYTAGAKRIGHGVDVAFEKNSDSLLEYMHQQKVAIEINLISNQFILKVRDDRHPVLLYHRHHVPIVISTDDAGILRTNLIEQFVVLSKRYPELTYSDIKGFIRNSIAYSFIKEPALKDRLAKQLDLQLDVFEEGILKRK